MRSALSPGRIPSLDGLRAVAISLVVYAHLALFRTVPVVDFGIDLGTTGVLVFFVISGYLITHLLLAERERLGSISLPSFYLRRAARILPALLLSLFVLAILAKLRLSNASIPEILWSLLFVGDYRISKFATLRHLWSLSVEEQFYLLWPVALSKLTSRAIHRLLVGVLLMSPLLRLVYFLGGAGGPALDWHFESVADGVAMGCLLALNRSRLHESHIYRRFVSSPLPALLPLLVWLASWRAFPLFSSTLGRSLVFLFIAIGIDAAICRANSIVGRMLNSPVPSLIGRWSYALYLWQQIFLCQLPGAQPYSWFPMNLLLSLVAAALSFYLVEQPFIALGRRARSALTMPVGLPVVHAIYSDR